jgi:hypothetical protein
MPDGWRAGRHADPDDDPSRFVPVRRRGTLATLWVSVRAVAVPPGASPPEAAVETLRAVLLPGTEGIRALTSGRAVQTTGPHAHVDERQRAWYYWHLVQTAGPDHAYAAIFALEMPEAEADAPASMGLRAVLSREIPAAKLLAGGDA